MINTHKLELPLSRTNFHSPKGFRPIEVRQYLSCVRNNIPPLQLNFIGKLILVVQSANRIKRGKDTGIIYSRFKLFSLVGWLVVLGVTAL